MANYWVNPPPYGSSSGFFWVVGEQQNLSWATTASVNISLLQVVGENRSIISIYYMLIIFNYTTLKQTNKYDHFRNS